MTDLTSPVSSSFPAHLGRQIGRPGDGAGGVQDFDATGQLPQPDLGFGSSDSTGA